jgi:translation initiation factor 1
VIEKLELAPGRLAQWADELKRSLGCGGGVEGDAILLQGDQRPRARAWLEARGVRKVTMSG